MTCGSSLIISAFFLPYGTGLGRAIRDVEEMSSSCPHNLSIRSRNTVSCALSRLKRNGMVSTRGPKKKTVWLITARGKNHFKKISTAMVPILPLDDGKARMVVFDIPEEERKKRDWLRRRLLLCEYEPLQKSVWIGSRPLPAELMNELRSRRLISYIHIIGFRDNLRLGKN